MSFPGYYVFPSFWWPLILQFKVTKRRLFKRWAWRNALVNNALLWITGKLFAVITSWLKEKDIQKNITQSDLRLKITKFNLCFIFAFLLIIISYTTTAELNVTLQESILIKPFFQLTSTLSPLTWYNPPSNDGIRPTCFAIWSDRKVSNGLISFKTLAKLVNMLPASIEILGVIKQNFII